MLQQLPSHSQKTLRKVTLLEYECLPLPTSPVILEFSNLAKQVVMLPSGNQTLTHLDFIARKFAQHIFVDSDFYYFGFRQELLHFAIKMQKQLRIVTRSSALAMAQTNYVIAQLGHECETIKVSNEVGDVNLQDPLYQMPTIGVFTKCVEQYLLDNRADVAVHSLKDLPTVIDPKLYLAAYTKFEERGDVVLLNKNFTFKNLNELPDGFKIGTSSLRRIATIRSKFPKLTLLNIRGNLNTRIAKLDEGQFDAIILAKAGLLRLGLGERISFDLDEKEFLYAPAQAALGIQCRIDDEATIKHLQILNDSDSLKRCTAERMFLNQLEGGCRLPIAVYSECRENGNVYIKGRVLAIDGSKVIEDEAEDEYSKVGIVLCEKIRKLGGVELIESLKQQK